MARLLTCGFEMGDARCEVPINSAGASITHLTGIPTISTSTVRSGSRSLKIDLSLAGQQVRISGFSGMEQGSYMRVYARFEAFPSSGAAYVMGRPVGVGIKINSSGQLEAWFNNVTLSQVSSALSLNTWYRIEMKQTIRAAATDDIEFRLNGTSWYTSNGVERNSANSSNFDLGHNASAGGCIYYLDDLAANDEAAGPGQTNWPGDGKVVMLNPISDNSRAGYTGGAGGTTNLYDAVNNRPPVGTTAAADTNLTQIKSIVSNTTDNFQPNLESYTTAGIASTDQVLFVQPFHRIGNATSTTARSMGIQGTSNPAITETTGNQPASITAAEPSNTWYCRAVVSHLPVVTLGTSPVIRTRKNTATTDECAVDAMGAYVEYAPLDTTVSDDFNRTEDPVSADGQWSGPIKTGDQAGETNGTQYVADSGVTESAIRVDFGRQADVEVSGVLGTIVENYLFARVADASTATPDGYCAVALPGNVVEIYILTNGTLTRLGASISTAVASGDTFKLTVVGSTIKAFVNGAEVGSRSDATYASGFVGIQAYNGGQWTSWAANPPPTIVPLGTSPAVSNATLALSSSGYAGAVLADSPRVYYRLGESSGQPQDSSGNGNHTTGTEGTPTYSRPGAITTEASNNAIGFAASPAKSFWTDEPNTIELGNTFTLEAWVNPSGSGDRTICSVEGEQEIRINASNELELLRSNIASVVVSNVTVPNGTWAHVVATKAGATVKLYINGVDRTGSVTSVTLASGGTFWVGRQGGAANFIGDLDEIAAYTTALSQARVQAHYTAGAGAAVTVALGSSPALSNATLALTAAAGVPLGSSPAQSNATLALTAAAKPTLQTAAAISNATLALTAATRVTLGTSPALSNATLALTAKPTVVLASSPALSNASLALTAATRVVLGSSPAQSAATLTLTAAARVVLATSPALSSATLTLTAVAQVVLGTAAAISTATCEVGILIIYQYARPESDVAATGWTATPLWDKLDETTPSDGDFVTGVAS